MTTDKTRVFRAAYTIPYTQALLALTEYAREHKGFDFGPIGSVAALLHNGLTVSGHESVVEAVTRYLESKVPGLYVMD